MADAIESKLLDKRVAQRYLRKGILDEKEYKKHLDSLPDLAEQADTVEAELEESAPPRPRAMPDAAATDEE